MLAESRLTPSRKKGRTSRASHAPLFIPRSPTVNEPFLPRGVFHKGGSSPYLGGTGERKMWLLPPTHLSFLHSSRQHLTNYISIYLLSSHTKCKLQEDSSLLCLLLHPESLGPRTVPGTQQHSLNSCGINEWAEGVFTRIFKETLYLGCAVPGPWSSLII